MASHENIPAEAPMPAQPPQAGPPLQTQLAQAVARVLDAEADVVRREPSLAEFLQRMRPWGRTTSSGAGTEDIGRSVEASPPVRSPAFDDGVAGTSFARSARPSSARGAGASSARGAVDGVRVSRTAAGIRVAADVTVRRGASLPVLHARLHRAVDQAVAELAGEAPSGVELMVLGFEDAA